jgi:hypothetical protein
VSATNYRTWVPFAIGGGGPSRLFDTFSGAAIPTPSWDSQVTDVGTPAFSPDGKWIAFNHEDLDQGHTLSTMSYDKATNTWQPQVALDSLTSFPTAPRLSVDPSGNAIVTWTQSNGSTTGVYARRYSTATNTWLGAAELMETNASSALSPVAAINASGQAIVVWTPTDGTNKNVRANRYNGSAWSGAVTIETNSNPASTPSVALDAAGNASVVWQQSDGVALSIYLNRYDSVANTWLGPTLPLESTSIAAGNPQIEFDQNGNGIAAWAQGSSLYVRQYNKASNSWQPAVDLSSGVNLVGSFDLDLDASGNAIVTWKRSRNSSRLCALSTTMCARSRAGSVSGSVMPACRASAIMVAGRSDPSRWTCSSALGRR